MKENLLYSFFYNLEYPFFITNSDGLIVLLNKSAAGLCKIKVGEYLDKKYLERIINYKVKKIELEIAGVSRIFTIKNIDNSLYFIEKGFSKSLSGNSIFEYRKNIKPRNPSVRIIDKDYNVIFVNDEYLKLSGLPLEECIGKKCFSQDSRINCYGRDRCPFNSGYIFPKICSVENPSGLHKSYFFTIDVVYSDTHEVERIIETFYPLSNFNKYLRNNLVKKRMIKDILNSLNTGVALLNKKSKVVFINEKWKYMLTYLNYTGKVTEYNVSNVFEALGKYFITPYEGIIEKILLICENRGGAFQEILKIEAEVGIRYYILSVKEIIVEGSSLIMLEVYNVTELTNLETSLINKNRELESILNIAIKDIRPSLYNILNYASEMFDRVKRIEAREADENKKFILESISSIDKMLDGLNKLSELNKIVVTEKTIDLGVIISGILTHHGNDILKKKIDVSIEKFPLFKSDRYIVEQIFQLIFKRLVEDSGKSGSYISLRHETAFEGNIKYFGVIIDHNIICYSDFYINKIFKLYNFEDVSGQGGIGPELYVLRKLLMKIDAGVSFENPAGDDRGIKFYFKTCWEAGNEGRG